MAEPGCTQLQGRGKETKKEEDQEKIGGKDYGEEDNEGEDRENGLCYGLTKQCWYQKSMCIWGEGGGVGTADIVLDLKAGDTRVPHRPCRGGPRGRTRRVLAKRSASGIVFRIFYTTK